MTTNTLYEVYCSYCNTIYNYKEYQNNEWVTISNPSKDYETTLRTDGICETCKDDVYKQYGLEDMLK